jgi:hypothetical protein
MLRSLLTLTLAIAALQILAPVANAWGAYHRGYTHVGPYGVQHYGYTAARGPYGGGASMHYGATGYGGAHYGYGGGYHYGGYGAYGGYHGYAAGGGYAVGGYHYGGAYGGAYGVERAGVYRGY